MVSHDRKQEIGESQTFKTAIKNIVTNSNRAHVSKNTEYNYLDAVNQYLQFVNSEGGLKKELTLDDLIEEAKINIEKTKERIRLFFLWLQNESLSNFEPRVKKMLATSALIRAYGQVKGVYTNNNILFGKWKTPNLSDMKKEAIENDTNVPFFKLDKKRNIFLDRGMIKQFLSNLKLRDQTIFLAMLSSSHDGGDLFSLKVGDICKQKERERFYWEGQRLKTGIRFKVFFSTEATDFIRRYLEQERHDAKDNEPLFTIASKESMDAQHLSSVFRDAARKIGVTWQNGEQSPLRPKRLRHIFRTACNHAHVDEGYINAYMGHKSTISQAYLEKDITILELEYSKVEPFLTVYGVGGVEGLEQIQTELLEIKSKYVDQEEKIKGLETQLENLTVTFKDNVEAVAQDLIKRRWKELVGEHDEAIKEEQKWREEKTKETQTLPKQKEESKPIIVESSVEKVDESLSKKEESKSSPKKEKSWRELVYGNEQKEKNTQNDKDS